MPHSKLIGWKPGQRWGNPNYVATDETGAVWFETRSLAEFVSHVHFALAGQTFAGATFDWVTQDAEIIGTTAALIVDDPYISPNTIKLEEDVQAGCGLVWDIASGITMAQRIEEVLSPLGWHCGLTGSVLFTGGSSKDLDIIVYPHKMKYDDRLSGFFNDELRKVFNPLLVGLGIIFLKDQTATHNEYGDSKVIWVARTSDDKRIDFFFIK